MTKEEIKKELSKMVKDNKWNKCYGTYGVGTTMGRKQMDNNIALISFGFTDDDRYDAKEAEERFLKSNEFNSFIGKINGTWHEEIRKVDGSNSIYIVIHY